ncbi:MAG: histidine phosphatase family protein [Nocardioides sp.]|nr:histidine phosphatase family protein [Nocardioides sp.]
MRHGETDWNAEERAQGHADVPLNAVGHAQAKTVAQTLAAFGPARLWSSDLARRCRPQSMSPPPPASPWSPMRDCVSTTWGSGRD